MPLPQSLKRLFAIHQLSSFCLCEAMLDLRGDLGTMIGKPLFLLVRHLNGMRDEFIGGPIQSALHVLLD